MSEENVKENVESIPFPTNPNVKEGSIELNDLNVNTLNISPALVINALKCIDAAANRGAYHGGELSSVGGVRDQLYSMVSTIVEELSKQEKAKVNTEAK
jgi:hypothetical protein